MIHKRCHNDVQVVSHDAQGAQKVSHDAQKVSHDGCMIKGGVSMMSVPRRRLSLALPLITVRPNSCGSRRLL